MIASERSLASAHQSQSQQQRPATLVKARNGANKPPVRPVKIYVIDPRKLQQRLEAYVDQKNQKRAAEVEAEKERRDKEKQEKEKLIREARITLPSSIKSSISANSTVKSSPTKLLPAIAPKFTPPPSATTTASATHPETTVLGNGVTLQSLPCINAASLGLPALPLVVTNGVALIQSPISQSSIPTGGLFLPGVTAIPSVDGTFIGPSPQQAQLLKAKPRTSTTPKRKAKKKKTAKKRKVTDDKEKEDYDDGELSYLLKETTTRAGRISRPMSQPHSPSFVASISSTSSRAPSPTSKMRKKVDRKEDTTKRCEACSKVCVNDDKLKEHLDECSMHNRHQEKMGISPPPLKETISSTNAYNIQGPATSSSVSISPPISVSVSHLGSMNTTPVATTSTAVVINLQSSPVTTSAASQTEISGTISSTSTVVVDNLDLLANCNSEKACNGDCSPPANTEVPVEIPNTSISSETFIQNALTFSISSNSSDHRDIVLQGRSSKYAVAAMESDHAGVNVASLVPSVNESHDLFARCMSASSSVVQVPSSYSLPSSPPSRCHSPGLPENIFGGTHLLAKQATVSSPVPTCNSPIDPMLLRSRSPFPPPIAETSLHFNGASNLSIPEESLCKGELFMDLGDGVLDNTTLSAISPTPFCNNESSIRQLFTDTAMKEPDEPQQTEEETLPDPGTPEIEPRNSNPSSPVVTPMLLETTTEDANDGEIFQTANFVRKFLHPSIIPSTTHNTAPTELSNVSCEDQSILGRVFSTCSTEFPRTPQSAYVESDVSMDSSEATLDSNVANNQRCRSIWQFVKDQIKSHGISQACGEISEMADKLSRIARDHFIPIREEEIERSGNASSIIHVDTPFFSHLLDLPFGMYIFKEDAGTRRKIPPPPPMTSSELSFTCGVDDVEKFLPPDIDLISLPHLTNLDLT